MMTSLVQLTDTHIREPGRVAYGRLDTAPFLARAVHAVNTLRRQPDAVVLTGDLTDFGRADEYAHLRELLSPLKVPFYLLPGNHDSREGLRAAFPDHAYLGQGPFVQYWLDIGPLRLISLDTVVPQESYGALCDDRLAWLENVLMQSTHKPVVIAMHHPPFRTLIGHMDDIGLLHGGVELEALVRRFPNIERIICGHLHRPIDVRFGGTVAATAPAPAHQVTLNLAPDASSDWMLEPPAFRIHAWDDVAARLVTHTAAIGQFDGPYPFHENGSLID